MVAHLGGATRTHRIGVPRRGFWTEVINSNSEYYGGTGLGNDGGREAEEEPRDGFSHSLNVAIAPFTTTVFKWTAG